MDGTGNGELVPLPHLGTAPWLPFPFLNPVNTVKPLLVALFQFLDYLVIHPLDLKPFSPLLTGSISLHSLEPEPALAELQLVCPLAQSPL